MVASPSFFHNIGDPVLIISHPRSGTHLTIDFLRKNFLSFKSYKLPLEPNHYLYLSIEGFFEQNTQKRLTQELAKSIISRPRRPIIKAHTYSYDRLWKEYPDWMQWIEQKGKTIYVYRNIFDVLQSSYWYFQSFLPSAHVPFSEFIKQPFAGRKTRVHYWNEMMVTWMTKTDVYHVKHEDIIMKSDLVGRELASLLNEKLKYDQPQLPRNEKSLIRQRLQRIFSISPDSSAIIGMKRKSSKFQTPHYSSEDKSFIYSVVRDTFQEVGYSL